MANQNYERRVGKDVDLKMDSEQLSCRLPFLSRGLGSDCTKTLSDNVRSLVTDYEVYESSNQEDTRKSSSTHKRGIWKDSRYLNDTNSFGSSRDIADRCSQREKSSLMSGSPKSKMVRMSWTDRTQKDELEEKSNVNYTEKKPKLSKEQKDLIRFYLVQRKSNGNSSEEKPKLSKVQEELIQFNLVRRKTDFVCIEHVNRKPVNILDGLELHTGIFNDKEQRRIVKCVENLQKMGQMGQLRERTYAEPRKWMPGKGRVTIQFGCCFNYQVVDNKGNTRGILKNERADPIPHTLKEMIKRMVLWHVLPPDCIPDSCIINIYNTGDCIPPHIDSHDFVRPFCTVSFLSECKIVFGSNLKTIAPGVFDGAYGLALPVGSVLVFGGNGADVAKHCVPAVPTKRISITFRRIHESKRPDEYAPEPDLQGLQPLSFEADTVSESNSPKPSVRSTTKQPLKREVRDESSYPKGRGGYAIGSSSWQYSQVPWQRPIKRSRT